MGAPSVGVFAKLVAGDESDDVVDEAYEFTSETMTRSVEHIGGVGISGDRQVRQERIVEGTIDVSGSITMEPTPDEMDKWLPRILGGAKQVDNTISIANTLPEFILEISKVGRAFKFANCKVNRATIRVATGSVVELTLDVLAKTFTTPASITSVPLVQAAPYVFHEGVLTLIALTREFNEAELTIENNLLGDIYRNSQTRSHIPEGPVAVTFNPTLPFTADEVDILNQTVAGAAATLVLTKGAKSLTVALGNLKFNGPGPQVGSRDGEILYSPTGTAYKTAAADAIKFTSVL